MSEVKLVALRLLKGYLLVVVFMVLTQDLQIFPGAAASLLNSRQRPAGTLPPDVESSFVRTADGDDLEVWRLRADREHDTGFHAIVFHGNAGDVGNFFGYQKWLRAVGLTSYGFDYRGFGHSSGWPSEHGLYNDADAIWRYLTEDEHVPPDKIVLVGISIGTGPASYLASTRHPVALVLFAPFTSLRDVVAGMPLFGHMSFCVWSVFPAAQYVADLRSTAVIAAHGLQDTVIPHEHTERLAAAYRGSGGFSKFFYEKADHNNILYFAANDVAQALLRIIEAHRD